MNFIYYENKKNKTVFFCWFSLVVVLTIAYYLEYLKGSRSLQYLLCFMIVLWGTYVYCWKCYREQQLGDKTIRYKVGISWLVVYAFVQLTSLSVVTFVYLFPMLCVLIVYGDLKLIDLVSVYGTIINIITVALHLISEPITKDIIVFYEIQIACIILCSVFLHFVTKLIVYSDKQLKMLADSLVVDSLTKVYNRYFLETLIVEDFRNNQNVSLAIIDIDDFKGINDTHGHMTGDDVLKQLCEDITKLCNIYKDTFVIRLGGDEFIILSFSLNKEALIKVCRLLCEKPLKVVYKEKDIHYTISIGVANTLSDSCLQYKTLYDKADKYLYEVKNKGKSSVCGWLY